MITIVITATNKFGDYANPFIESIRKYEPRANIILIDNASSEPFNIQGVNIIRNETQQTWSHMLNTGANAAPDGWLMLFNDDVLCYGAFAETVGGFDKNTLYGPNILKKPAFWVGKPIQYLYGWMIIVQKTAFLDVGGFDENYIAAGVDDIDFCWTAQNKGYRIKSVKLPFTHIADQPDFDHRRKKWDDKYEQNMEKNRQRFAEKVKNG